MTNEIIINDKKRAIIISKSFQKAASIYGTEAYDALKGARADFPNYKVITSSRKAENKEHYKGLTFEFMEAYIAAHDDQEGSAAAKYQSLRGNAKSGAASESYYNIKLWFLAQFPAIKEFHDNRAEIVNRIRESAKKEQLERREAIARARKEALIEKLSA